MKLSIFSKTFIPVSILSAIGLLLSVGSANAANLTFGSIVDNGPEDLDPVLGIIRLANYKPGGSGISFTGEIQSKVTKTFAQIRITNGSFINDSDGLLTTVYSPFSVDYPFDPGPGILGAQIKNVRLVGPGQTTGNESVELVGTASTFNNNSAIASVKVAANQELPFLLNALQIKQGEYSGPGKLEGILTITLDAHQRLNLNGLTAEATVPEPTATIGLLALGALATGSVLKRTVKNQ